MENRKLAVWARVMIAIAAVALVIVLFVPMWQIELAAPQYPEGLVLLIFPNKLGGNVDIINGLNHYIGMKTLHTNDFIEFTILPYIIGFFALFLFLEAVLGSKKLLNVIFILFLCFGVIALIDFWKWEYNYGHNLNPDAAIIVPGMAYQPPLIGFKQLLNFGAYSIPDIGGWLFIMVGIILFFLVALPWFSRKKNRQPSGILTSSIVLMACLFTASCNTKPQPLLLGKDHCEYCKMTVMDNRFGAELITTKGKLYKFDDAHCILSFLKGSHFDHSQIKDIFFVDFVHEHAFIKAADAVFLKSEALKSPMEGNIAAFSDTVSLQETLKTYPGTVVHWDEIVKF